VLFVLIPFLGHSQVFERVEALSKTEHYLNLFLRTDFENRGSSHRINSLITTLEKKKKTFSSDKEFLEYLFIKTHQKILKHYVEQCTFTTTVQDGIYNCLTGTALYALLLDHFNIDYRVVETNYHIFLVARTVNGNILIEATDPAKGFVTSPTEVNKRIALYKENKPAKSKGDKVYYQYQFSIYNTVGLDELLGLMYYNLSINAYNENNLPVAINYLDCAIKLYQSPRMEELSKIILLTLHARSINNAEKDQCLKKIQSLRSTMPGVASSVMSD